MTSDAVVWTYSLAEDVRIDRGHDGAFLRTPTGRTRVEAGELAVLQFLTGVGTSEADIQDRLPREVDEDAGQRCAAVLFRLDRLGLLVRRLHSRGRHLASCVPRRPPSEAAPARPPEGPLRLSPRAFARAEENGVCLETPGGWATTTIHDRDLVPLLFDLGVGQPAAAIAAVAGSHPEAATLALLAMMSWCGLFDRSDEGGWSGHDLLLHTRTRMGYRRVLLGKTYPAKGGTPDPDPSAEAGRSITLEPPSLHRLLADDPPYALVSERRRSIRRQGSEPLTTTQVSELLFRTLHEREGRRPYPSGGSCYPLQAYLAVRRCRGIAPGLYAYHPARHELTMIREPGPRLDELLTDAAAAADAPETPQILLVLAARYARTHRVYGDLAYSLILKEAGAVFQTAMMAAAAMGVGACPLGCGNSLLFADLLRLNPLVEVSVGEMMVGSVDDSV